MLERCPLLKCPLLEPKNGYPIPLGCPMNACKPPSPEFGAFTDPRDGREYRTVKIGAQTWMAENLAFDYAGSKVYGNDLANLAKYGRLYDWETAKKACPPGWHLPSNDEWSELCRFADGTSGKKSPYSSETAGKHLKAASGWSPSGLDTYGFAALPGGGGYPDGNFLSAGGYGLWWSASEYDSYHAYIRYMYYDGEYAYWDHVSKTDLYSVRCIKDAGVGGAK